MNNFIITSNHPEYTFVIYSEEEEKVVFRKEKIDSMIDESCEERGRVNFRPFGIAQDEKHIYIASNSNIGLFDKKTYDYIGIVEDIKCDINTHQILRTRDYLIVCNTATDSLGILNIGTREARYLLTKDNIFIDTLPRPENVYDYDSFHLNSLCVHNESMYVLMHNKGKPSSVFVYDINTLNLEGVIDCVGYFNHGLFVNDKNIYTLSTGTSELMKIDRGNYTMTSYRVTSESLFLRGMAYADNYIYFGCSNNRSMPFHYNFSFIRKYDMCKDFIVNDLVIKDIKIISDFQILESMDGHVPRPPVVDG